MCRNDENVFDDMEPMVILLLVELWHLDGVNALGSSNGLIVGTPLILGTYYNKP